MKILLIAYLAALALLGAPTQGQEDPVHINVPVVKVPVQVIHEGAVDEEIIEVEDEDDIDIKRMFQDLFHYDYDEKKSEREGRELEGEDEELQAKQSVLDPQVISKYNGFIDAFFNRLSDEMRLNHDPMNLVIRQSGEIDAEGGKNFKRNKMKNLKKRGKKRKVHPKDVSAVTGEGAEVDSDRSKREITPEAEENLDEYEYYDDEEADDYEDLEGRALETGSDLAYDDEYDYEDYEEYEDDEEGLQKTREGKSLTVNEEVKNHKDDDDDSDLVEDDEEGLEETREGKSMTINEEAENHKDDDDSDLVEGRRRGPRQRRRRRRKGGRGRRRRKKCGQFCQRRRRKLRRRRLRNRRRGKRSAENPIVPTAVISGISNMKRVGNVRVFDRENSQDIVADFGIGPIVLRAKKMYGKGSQKDIREAQALASLVMGEVIVNVNRRGEARVKRMKLLRPNDIQVTGTLRKKENLKSDKAMESFVRRTRPVVSRTMKQAATRIFRIAKNSSKKNNGLNI